MKRLLMGVLTGMLLILVSGCSSPPKNGGCACSHQGVSACGCGHCKGGSAMCNCPK